jgi:hypothetical protein
LPNRVKKIPPIFIGGLYISSVMACLKPAYAGGLFLKSEQQQNNTFGFRSQGVIGVSFHTDRHQGTLTGEGVLRG